MPFAFSHPALVIPLLRAQRRFSWLSDTGLIAGSIAHAFEKFFRLHLASQRSHTVASIFYFSLPVPAALAFVFHLVVRGPLLAHLPAWLQRRVGKYAGLDWLAHFRQHHGGVLLSIGLGAVGHLLWDSFTHPNALTRSLPGGSVLVHLGGRELNVYHLSGVVNSVLGGLAIAWCACRSPPAGAGYPTAPRPGPIGGWWPWWPARGWCSGYWWPTAAG